MKYHHQPTKKPPEGNADRQPKGKFNIQWLYLLFFALFIFSYIVGYTVRLKDISWKKFEKDLLQTKAVEKINIVNNEVAEIFIKKELSNNPAFKEVMKMPFGEGINLGPHYQLNIGSVDSFEKKLEEAQRNFSSEEKVNVSYIKGASHRNILT
jgi:AFG3 family protein